MFKGWGTYRTQLPSLILGAIGTSTCTQCTTDPRQRESLHTCIYRCPHWTSHSGFLESKRMPKFGTSFGLSRTGSFLFGIFLPLLSFLCSLHHLLYLFLTSGLSYSPFSISLHPSFFRPSPALLSHPSLHIYFHLSSGCPFPHSVSELGCLLHLPSLSGCQLW